MAATSIFSTAIEVNSPEDLMSINITENDAGCPDSLRAADCFDPQDAHEPFSTSKLVKPGEYRLTRSARHEDFTSEDSCSADGYGGVHPALYDSIVAFKKDGSYPLFLDKASGRRSAACHWRTKCSLFAVADSGLLLYCGKKNNTPGRVVVRMGEVRLALRYIHEKLGHAGQKHMCSVINSRLYWKGFRRDAAKFITECEFCRRKKTPRKCIDGSEIDDWPPMITLGEEEDLSAVAQRLLLSNDDELQHYYGHEMYELLDDNYEEEELEEVEDDMQAHMLLHESATQQEHERYEDDGVDGMQAIEDEELEVGGDGPRDVPQDSLAAEQGFPFVVSSEEVVPHAESIEVSESRRIAEGRTKRRHSPPARDEAKYLKLAEENEVLRERLRIYETAYSTGALAIPAADPLVTQMQKDVLSLQREVLQLKKQYLTAQLANLPYYPDSFEEQADVDREQRVDSLLIQHQ